MNIAQKIFLYSLISYSGNVNSQIKSAGPDSINSVLLNKQEVSLTKYGPAQIKMKDGTIYKNCVITLIKPHYIVYTKNKTLHDHMIDKIAKITFVNYPLQLQFNNEGIGLLSFIIKE